MSQVPRSRIGCKYHGPLVCLAIIDDLDQRLDGRHGEMLEILHNEQVARPGLLDQSGWDRRRFVRGQFRLVQTRATQLAKIASG